MTLKLSINKNIVGKQNPFAQGWRNTEFTLEELIEHIRSGYAFSHAVLIPNAGGKKPSKSDVDYTQMLILDIDNAIKEKNSEGVSHERVKTAAEGYYSYQAAVNDKAVQENALFVYTTISNTSEHNRFRIVFLLPDIINNQLHFSNIAKAFIVYFHADKSCHNIDRLWFGAKDCEYKIFNKTLTREYIDQVLSVNSNNTPKTNKIEKNNHNQISPEQCADMLSYIPAVLEYDEWGKIVSAVGNTYDEETAVKLIDNWSPDTERGTSYRIKNRSPKPTIASVIYYAKREGYPVSTLYQDTPGIKGSIKKKTNSEKNLTNDIDIVEDFLMERYNFRYNIVKGSTEFKKKEDDVYEPLDDRIVAELWRLMKKSFVKVSQQTLDNILKSEFVPKYHPFKEYFSSLPPWDEENDYIQQFIDLVEVEAGQQDRWQLYFTKWIVGVVACALEQGENHGCIVLVGEQGIGKTTLVGKLVPPELLNYYAVAQLNPNDKDSKILVAESFLINLDELESSTRDEIGHLKSLITIKNVTVRRPYARHTETTRRRASFIGSVNRSMFLTDVTGTRRFLTVDVKKINYTEKLNIEQLYAQALFMLNNDFIYWFHGKEVDLINEANIPYSVTSSEEELLLKTFVPYDPSGISNEELRVKEASSIFKKNYMY